MKSAITDNKHRITIASYDLARKEALERVGYWHESGTPQEYVMRLDNNPPHMRIEFTLDDGRVCSRFTAPASFPSDIYEPFAQEAFQNGVAMVRVIDEYGDEIFRGIAP